MAGSNVNNAARDITENYFGIYKSRRFDDLQEYSNINEKIKANCTRYIILNPPRAGMNII